MALGIGRRPDDDFALDEKLQVGVRPSIPPSVPYTVRVLYDYSCKTTTVFLDRFQIDQNGGKWKRNKRTEHKTKRWK